MGLHDFLKIFKTLILQAFSKKAYKRVPEKPPESAFTGLRKNTAEPLTMSKSFCIKINGRFELPSFDSPNSCTMEGLRSFTNDNFE